MNKNLKNIFYLFISVFLVGINIFTNPVFAFEKELNVRVYFNDRAEGLRFNGKHVTATDAWYKDREGKEQPAYCINPNLGGVGEEGDYNVNINAGITDAGLIGIVLNGYPYKSYTELGVNSVTEAYTVTKSAIWAYLDGSPYKGIDNWSAMGGKEYMLEAMKKIYNEGIKNTEFKPSFASTEPDTDKAVDDGDYLSQVRMVETNYPALDYEVKIKGNAPQGTIITDENDNPKTEFKSGEKFKVRIPKTSVGDNESGIVELEVQVRIECEVLLYGKAERDNVQNYAVSMPIQPVWTPVKVPYGKEPEVPEEVPNQGKLKIVKVAEGTEEPLAGAEFKVTHATKGVLGVYITNSNGEIIIDNIDEGAVYIEELHPPFGYALDDVNKHQDVVVKADEETIVSFSNKKLTTLEVIKVDADTNEVLQGATIKVAKDGGHESWEMQTDSSGKIYLDNLTEGTYDVIETVAPQGYLLNSERHTIKILNGQDHTLTIKNKKKTGIIIKKYDEGTSLPLEGAEFSVAEKGGSIVYEGIVDENGLLHIEGLKSAWYTISELAPPFGYLISTESKDVFLPEGGTVEVKFDNRERPKLEILKVDESTKKPLQGAKFKVWKTEDSTVSEYITDENGRIFIENLDEGIYSIEEILPPEGYLLSKESHKDIELVWGTTKTVIFTNLEKPKLEIIKIDKVTKEGIPNTKFHVKKTEDNTTSEYLTDENGKILIDNLDEAIYSVFETVPNDLYLANPIHKDIELEGGKTKQLIFENERKPTIIITKINNLTQKPVKGTTFRIECESADGGVYTVGTYKTNENGQIIIPKVDVGWYRFIETIPAQGMQLPSNPVTRKYLSAGENAYLDLGNSGTGNGGNTENPNPNEGKITVTSGWDYVNEQGEIIENYPLNSIIIKKIDAITSEMLEGAVFEVRRLDGQQSGTSGTVIGRYNTDSSGVIVITGMESGQYVIEEVKPPINYLLSENSKQTTSLKADGTSVVEVTFQNFPYGHILVTKVDALTNKPLANARFKVTGGDGSAIGNTTGEYVTDENGQFLVENIKPQTVVVTEIEAPPNYAIDTTPQTVNIGTDGKVYKLSFKDNPYGTLVIKKYNKNDNTPLAGAEFFVTNTKGDVIGDSNGIFISDQQGTITIPNLDKQSLIVKETKSPEGFILEQQTQTIDIEYGQTHVLNFYNTPKNTLVIKKYNSYDNSPLAGAEFFVTNSKGEYIGNSNGVYTTDQQGTITISNLDDQTLIIKEKKSPEGFILEQKTETVEVKGGKTFTVNFYNSPKASLIVKKVDEKGKPLAGAVFRVERQNGAVIGEFTSDIDGTFIVPEISPQWVTIREQKSPEGYVLDESPKTVEIKEATPTIVTFVNKKISGLQIKKIDEDSKMPLAGVVFTIEKLNGERVGDEYVTDENGFISVELEPNHYVIRELKTKDGYILDNTPKTVEVKAVEPTIVTFTNKKLGGLQIRKVDQEGNPLSNVHFTVEKLNGEFIGDEHITDNDGLIFIPDLAGDFIIRETKGKEGYKIDGTPKNVTVKPNELKTVTFVNDKLGGLQIRKVDQEGNPLSNVHFTVEKLTGEFIGDEHITDNDGLIFIPDLAGDFIIRETKGKEGYKIDGTPKNVTVKLNEIKVVTFVNDKLGGLQIRKVDQEGNPLSNVHFTVEKLNGEFIGDEHITDNDGLIFIPDIVGDFVVRETKGKDGYKIDGTPKNVTVKLNEIKVVTFVNDKLGGLQIRKVDQEGNPLSNIHFTVERLNGERIGDEHITDNDGLIFIPDIVGDFVVRETKGKDGYKIDGTPKNVTVKLNEVKVVTFVNDKLGGLQIRKTDQDGNPLAGVHFTVEKLNGERIGDEHITDNDGLIFIPDIVGDFVIRETKGKDGYKIDGTPRNTTVKLNEIKIEKFINTRLAGLKIVKLSSADRKPLEGVEFSITKMNGERITGDLRSDVFKTDKNGTIFIPNLPDGNYIVRELKTVEGFFLDEEPKIVDVKMGQDTLLEVLNELASGLLIVKTDANTGKPLQGVVFDIMKADGQRVQSSILDKNQPNTLNNSPNKTTTPNGDISGSYTTDRNGRILINHLEAGEYHVVERKQLDGYVLDTDVHSITVTQGKQAVLQLQNKQLSGLKIKKIDSITKQGIYNTEFMVFDSNGKVVGNFYTDNQGVIDFSAILEEGRYTIRETRPSEGYYNDDIPRTVEFISGKMTEIVWENIPKAGQIQVTKLSADSNEINGLDAGTPLEGAIFEVYSYKSGNLVDRFITKNDGKGVSKPLPLGRYLVKEVQAPPYYKINNKELDIDIEFATQIIKLEFTNESANTGVSIDKVAPREVMQGQNIRYDIKTVRNDSTIPLTSFYWRDVLPVDAVRLDKIVTGTYSQSLRYKITATTNKGNNIIIADNLSTTKNNVIDCSNASLGLANDEFVTSFSLVFGNVKAGFCQVEEPKVYVNVLNRSFPSGYQFSNKVDIGGKTGDEWVIGNSTSVTKIYNPTPAKLPKTGY